VWGLYTPWLLRGRGPPKALGGGISKVNFQETLSIFGDKCPQNGSKTAPTAPRPHLGCPHEGSRVVVVCLGLGRGPPLPQGVSFQGLITSTRVCVGCGVWATRSGWCSHSNPLRRPRRARPDHQLPILDSSFTCEDYNTYRDHPWSPFPLRRAHPGPCLHTGSKANPSTVLELSIINHKP